MTGQNAGEVGDKAQTFVERYTDQPDRDRAAHLDRPEPGWRPRRLVLILITRTTWRSVPDPLVNGVVRLAPPPRREHLRSCSAAIRQSWIGWMQGVVIDMFVTS